MIPSVNKSANKLPGQLQPSTHFSWHPVLMFKLWQVLAQGEVHSLYSKPTGHLGPETVSWFWGTNNLMEGGGSYEVKSSLKGILHGIFAFLIISNKKNSWGEVYRRGISRVSPFTLQWGSSTCGSKATHSLVWNKIWLSKKRKWNLHGKEQQVMMLE